MHEFICVIPMKICQSVSDPKADMLKSRSSEIVPKLQFVRQRFSWVVVALLKCEVLHRVLGCVARNQRRVSEMLKVKPCLSTIRQCVNSNFDSLSETDTLVGAVLDKEVREFNFWRRIGD